MASRLQRIVALSLCVLLISSSAGVERSFAAIRSNSEPVRSIQLPIILPGARPIPISVPGITAEDAAKLEFLLRSAGVQAPSQEYVSSPAGILVPTQTETGLLLPLKDEPLSALAGPRALAAVQEALEGVSLEDLRTMPLGELSVFAQTIIDRMEGGGSVSPSRHGWSQAPGSALLPSSEQPRSVQSPALARLGKLLGASILAAPAPTERPEPTSILHLEKAPKRRTAKGRALNIAGLAADAATTSGDLFVLTYVAFAEAYITFTTGMLGTSLLCCLAAIGVLNHIDTKWDARLFDKHFRWRRLGKAAEKRFKRLTRGRWYFHYPLKFIKRVAAPALVIAVAGYGLHEYPYRLANLLGLGVALLAVAAAWVRDFRARSRFREALRQDAAIRGRQARSRAGWLWALAWRLTALVLGAWGATLYMGPADHVLYPWVMGFHLEPDEAIALRDPARPSETSLGGLSYSPDWGAAGPKDTPALNAAMANGAAYLRDHQNEDGSWGGRASLDDPYNNEHFRVPVSALAISALEKAHPDDALFSNLKAARYVFDNLIRDRAAIYEAGRKLHNNNLYPYTLAFGLQLLLKQYQIQSGEERLKYKAAIETTLEWAAFEDLHYIRFSSHPGTFEVALLAEQLVEARKLGFEIPESRLQPGTDALTYMLDLLQGSRLRYGGFPYELGHPILNPLSAPLGSAARDPIIEFVLYRAGRSDKAKLRRAVRAFMDNRDTLAGVLKDPNLLTHDKSHFDYAKYYYLIGVYYTSQCLHELGGGEAMEDAIELSSDLLERQRADGSWEDSPVFSGPAYGTAMAMHSMDILRRMISRQ